MEITSFPWPLRDVGYASTIEASEEPALSQ